MGKTSVGHFGNDTRNTRRDRFVKFAERNNLRIMNTVFKERADGKWTWRCPSGETKNEIDFILTGNPDIAKDVTVLIKLR